MGYLFMLERIEKVMKRKLEYTFLPEQKKFIVHIPEDKDKVFQNKGKYEYFQVFCQNDLPVQAIELFGIPRKLVMLRKDCHGPERFPVFFHRGGNCFVVNKNHELLMPIRSQSKDLYPGMKDVSVSEHNQVGESYFDCVYRGFEEELGFEPDIDNLKFIIKIPVISEDQSEICEYYLYKDNVGKISIAEDEIQSFEWISISDLQSRDLVKQINFRPDHAPALKYLLDNYLKIAL